MSTPLIFLDTETTGLSLDDDIWEFAGIRREPDGTESELHLFIRHSTEKCKQLPEPFLSDHQRRFPASHTSTWAHDATHQADAAAQISNFIGEDRAHIAGAVPNFDTERLARFLTDYGRTIGWHYHLIDVENLAVGYLWRKVAENRELGYTDSIVPPLPWDSDEISRAVGVDPPGEGERHTALGDARWAMHLYDAITGGKS